jgi:hypothetical protein
MKAEECIRDALQEIGQQAAEQPVHPDEMATGIRYLNRLFAEVTYLGFGYTIITSSSQTVTIPTYAESWAVLELARRLMPQFPSVEDSAKADIRENANKAWNNLLLLNGAEPEMSLPYILPIGSGNETNRSLSSVFYPEDDNNILQESGGSILLEDNA